MLIDPKNLSRTKPGNIVKVGRTYCSDDTPPHGPGECPDCRDARPIPQKVSR